MPHIPDDDARDVRLALAILRDYGPEAADGWQAGNSLAGSILSIEHRIPRQYAEPAVGAALELLTAETVS
jgi:hypothetical protein